MAKKDSKKDELKKDEVLDTQTGATNEVTKDEEPAVAEPPAPVLLSTGKWAVGPTTEIHCIDCGAPRIIKIQDAFQVTRCAACQKKAQNKKRAQKKKEKNRAASLERRLAEARALLAEHDGKAESQD